MIDISQSQIAIWLVRSIVLGIILGVFYDCIRLIRLFFGVSIYCKGTVHKAGFARLAVESILIFITDLIFWICAGICSIMLTFMMGGGVLRGISYLGIIAGFALYYVTLGRLVLSINRKIVLIIKKLLHALAAALFYPIKMLVRGLFFIYHLTIGRFLGKIIKYISAVRKKAVETEKIPENVASGEGEDLVYGQGSIGYRKKDRVSFGTPKSR